jgi:ribosomal protein L37AE/L43A
MKILVTKEQLDTIRENDSKKFNCDKCEHSWKIKPEDKFPYLCNMCGYDSHKKKYNYEELENFWKNYKKEEEVTEKWTEKYKKSIDCSNPKGFSQRAHCQGKKKNLKESKEEELENNGFDIEGIKVALNVMSELSNTYGDQVPLKFTLNTYELKKSTIFNTPRSKPILQLYINVKTENGELYEISQRNRHEISVELLGILEMFGLYNDERMSPFYSFHFNKKSSEDLI